MPLGGVFRRCCQKDWPASIRDGLIDFGSLVASWTQQNADMVGGLFQHCTNDTHAASD